jgi:hypothetical protein
LADNIARVQWSDINDSEEWEDGLAGNQEFVDSGAVMGFFPHARIVLLERGMRSIVSTGDIYSFNFPELTSQKGTISPWSAIEFGSVLYWLSEDGFYVGNADAQKNLSEKRVTNYFLNTVNPDRLYQVYGAYEPSASRIYWSYPSDNTDYNDRIMIYDWSLDRWSELEVNTHVIARIATASINMDSGTDSDDMDEEGLPSLDSRFYVEGHPLMIAVGGRGCHSQGAEAPTLR